MESRFCLKQLTESEVDSIMAFQKEIIAGLPDKTLLRKNTREMFQQCVGRPNYTLGVYEGEVLAALGILFDGSGTEEDLSVGLTKFQVKNAMNLKLIAVREPYRGNGLQRFLMGRLEDVAEDMGKEYLCATVSKDNVHSFQNLEAMGYVVDHEAEKYGGVTRCVVVKRIGEGRV